MHKTPKEMQYLKEEVWFPFSEDIPVWELDFHNLMLNDRVRMNAYKKAIEEVVKPGMVVLDIGTGTGILSRWAIQAGAKKVYSVEMSLPLCREAIKRNKKAGMSEKIEVINNISYKVKLPEKVDIIISEILGNLGDNEDMIPILNDVRARFLKKNGTMLPQDTKVYLAPISSKKALDQVKSKKYKRLNKKYCLDFDGFDTYYDVAFDKRNLITTPKLARGFKFDGKDKSTYSSNLQFKVNKNILFTGFGGFFTAKLSKNVVLDTSIGKKTSDCWKHNYAPIKNPLNLKKEDIVRLNYKRLYDETGKQSYIWDGNVVRKNKEISQFFIQSKNFVKLQ